jgi:hypothetical protein
MVDRLPITGAPIEQAIAGPSTTHRMIADRAYTGEIKTEMSRLEMIAGTTKAESIEEE